ncbi:MAG: hypothetical protein FJ354_06465 [Thaumarchaeota archaeon]|nr:hypothetical protein [Nitrososphaerota archaeon]
MAKKVDKKPVNEEKKKAKTTPAKKEKPAKKTKPKKQGPPADDGLVIIDEEFEEDKEAELEARKAYLEEARSQEVED